SDSLQRYRFREAGQELMNLARLGNKYLADEEPWKIIKQDGDRVRTIMFTALQIASALAILSEPFLPFTSGKLKRILGVAKGRTLSARLNEEFGQVAEGWNDVAERDVLISAGHQINPAELLFSKIEDDAIQAQLDKLEATKKINETMDRKVVGQ